MRRKVWLTTALLVPCWVIPTAAAQKSCAALTMAKLQNATIVSAADVAAGPFTLKSPLGSVQNRCQLVGRRQRKSFEEDRQLLPIVHGTGSGSLCWRVGPRQLRELPDRDRQSAAGCRP